MLIRTPSIGHLGAPQEQFLKQPGTMYGMLLESVQHYVICLHGDEAWNKIVMAADVHNMVFTTHGRYSDAIILRLASACSDVMRDRTREEYMCFFGQCFVEYCSHYGYDKIMRVSGRHYRDFLRGIDNLHETMRFSYPKMVNPSFYVEKEDLNGCVLHYRSKRIGFTHYVIGQLTQFATNYYSVRVDIDVLQERIHDKGCHVIFRLNFDNEAYYQLRPSHVATCLNPFPPIEQATFFKVFPFSLVFNESLRVTHAGPSLKRLFKRPLQGLHVNNHFLLRRPIMDLTYDNVLCHQSVMFELETRMPVQTTFRRHSDMCYLDDETAAMTRVYDDDTNVLLLKGQMRLMPDLRGIAFLCTPLLGNIDDLEMLRLKLNDLSMYDSSRDMVLRGWQHASAIEYTIEQQVKKSKQIGENMAQLDSWKQRSEQLLYAMIPQSIAERLRNGEDPINTCQMFDSVTIIFSYLVGFTEICMHLPALQCIELINGIFSMFDNVVDEYGIFKVETLGDAVYMAAGGVPDPTEDHAIRVADVALTLRQKIPNYNHLPGNNTSFNIRIGMHTGGVVAGVVGKRTPQYCLFGDTVNTASRMQTYSQPGAIHISEPCKKKLDGHGFTCHLRGTMDIKGKGGMSTYWLIGKEGEEPTQALPLSDVYTEYEQTADSPIREEPSRRLANEGFCMEATTVACHVKDSEDDVTNHDVVNVNHQEEEEREECDVRPFPKISVEDFKSFLAGKSKKADKAPLTCPFSGVKIDPCCLFTDNNEENDVLETSEPLPEKHVTDVSRTINGPRTREEGEDWQVEQPAGPAGEEPTANGGEEVDGRCLSGDGSTPGVSIPRNLSEISDSGLTFLDKVRLSIDGAANRLNESMRCYQAELRSERFLRGLGLTLSKSVDSLSATTARWENHYNHVQHVTTSQSFGVPRSLEGFHNRGRSNSIKSQSRSYYRQLTAMSAFDAYPLPTQKHNSDPAIMSGFEIGLDVGQKTGRKVAWDVEIDGDGEEECGLKQEGREEGQEEGPGSGWKIKLNDHTPSRKLGTHEGPTPEQRLALIGLLNADKRYDRDDDVEARSPAPLNTSTEDLFDMEDLDLSQ